MKAFRERLPFFAALLLFTIVFALSAWGISQIFPPATPTLVPDPTPTSWPVPQRFESVEYGVNVHLWWDRWAAQGSAGRPGVWHWVQEAGFTWVKQHLAWRDVEGVAKGHYEWWIPDQIVSEAEQAGVNLVFRIDRPPVWAFEGHVEALSANGPPHNPQDFSDFCYTLATRYRGRVQGYQIWNEPNLAREWWGYAPDPLEYVDLLRGCYIAIKQADPEALVISAALAPTGSGPPGALPDTDYLRTLYEAGAGPYFDLLGANAPGYKAPPEVSPDEAADPDLGYGGHRVFCFRHLEDIRVVMEQYGDVDKQVAVMEFGWTTDVNPAHLDYIWFSVTPEQQADYVVRAFEYAEEHWSPWIGPMFVWNMPDSHWTPEDEEFWWSIVDPFHWEDGDVRLAYIALVEMMQP